MTGGKSHPLSWLVRPVYRACCPDQMTPATSPLAWIGSQVCRAKALYVNDDRNGPERPDAETSVTYRLS